MNKPMPIEIAIIWRNEVGAACLQSLWANRNPERPMEIHILLQKGCGYDAAFFAHYPAIKLHSEPWPEDWTFSRLAALVPDAEKLLLLSQDTLVRGPLDELFDKNLGSNDAAAVKNCDGFLPPKKCERIYDDGVLLLNLPLLRNCQDREVKKPLFLSPCWNLPACRLYTHRDEWGDAGFNSYYRCHYDYIKELYTKAVILRYAGEAKPWEQEAQPFAAEWRVAYQDAPLAKHHFFPEPAPHSEPYLISVVIPTYNVEKYISETLDCVFSQSCQDLEVICADDGSTDHTVDIIRKYAEKHNNLTFLANAHANAGYQRNRGEEVARGKYIYFMDSDDLLEPDLLAKTSRYAEVMNLDVIYFSGNSVYATPELEIEHRNLKYAYTGKSFCPGLYEGWDYYAQSREISAFSPTPYTKLTRISYLRENHIRFLEVCQSNDIYQSYVTVLNAKRVAYLPDVLYHRRVRENSLVTNIHYKDVNRMVESRCANWVGICLLAKPWVQKEKTYFWIMYAAERAMDEVMDAMKGNTNPVDYSIINKYWSAQEIMEAIMIWQQYIYRIVDPKGVIKTPQMILRLKNLRTMEFNSSHELLRIGYHSIIKQYQTVGLSLRKLLKISKGRAKKYRGKLRYKVGRLKEILKINS